MADALAKLTDTATTDAATADLEAQMYGVEVDVLELIAESLGKVTKDTTYADVAEMVAQDMPRISKLLEDAGITASEFIEQLYDEMAELNDEWAAEYYEARGLTQAKVTEDAALSAALKSGKFTVENGIVNLCNSSVAMIMDADGNSVPIADAYRQAVNRVVRAMVGGETTKAKAVRDAVRALSNSGILVQYGSGQTRELYSAVRQNVEEGYRTTMQSLRDEQGRKFGADGVEISAHSQCAPDHQEIQGRQFTNAEFEKLNKSLDRPIGKYNCRHMTFPVIVGVSSKTYSKDDRDEMIAASNKKVGYTDMYGKRKTCTAYEFTQVQRQLETRIRKLRTDARLLNAAKQGSDDVDALIDKLTDRYKSISRQAKVRTRMERTGIDAD
jgi:hypothetical protein